LEGIGSGERWGINRLDLKEYFTASDLRTFSKLPEESARVLAASESNHAFQRLLKELPECTLKSGQSLDQAIEQLEKELLIRKIRPTLILAAPGNPLGSVTRVSGRFTPQWLMKPGSKRTADLMGEVELQGQKIPVYGIWTTGDPHLACVLQLPECVRWEQFAPASERQELNDVQGQFLIRLIDIAHDEAARKKYIAADPDWLKAQPNKERYLSLRVWLLVLERFKVNLIDRDLGLQFNLSSI